MAYLESKPRYEVLDGLRGVAAFIVVVYHLFGAYSSPGATEQIINHGYLAVDFFFALSGFVIGYAYDDRWSKMTAWDFFKRRIVRLHPMVIMGMTVGALLFYLGDGPCFTLINRTPWFMVLAIWLVGCLMIPAFPWWDIRGWGDTGGVYPLNGAVWSLMWEYLANIIYALFVRHFSRTALVVFVGLSSLLTIDVAMNLNTFGLLVDDSNTYTLIGGWFLTPEHIYIGISRLLYPFFAGLLLSRLGWRLKVKGGFWWCSLIVAAILCMPCVGKNELGWVNGLYCTIAVIAFFPFIIAMGAGSETADVKTTAWCRWLGAISYPLYITHQPLIFIQMSWAANHRDAPVPQHIFVAVALFIIAVAMAWAALKLYDEPVREWLKNHWLKRNAFSLR